MRYHLFPGSVICHFQHFLYFCMLLLLNYAFSIFYPPKTVHSEVDFQTLATKDHMWTRLHRQDQDSGLQQFRSGAVLLGNNTEAMGELRLPPSGGYAALQHYLNFVQVFNWIKNGTFTWILSVFVFVWVQSHKGLQQYLDLDHSRWFIQSEAQPT